MFRFFNFRRPRLKFRGRDEIVYLGEKENATIRYEATVDMVYIYLGDVSLWNSGEKISDEEKGVIKKRYRSSRPKKLERRMGILPCFRVGTMSSGWVE